MDLLLIRHGSAEERDRFAREGRPDEERPLSVEGSKKMIRNARGLVAAAPRIDLLATSPLVRARQTAEILAEVYQIERVEVTDRLSPDGAPVPLLTWLRGHRTSEVVALVGHEPSLSRFIGYLLGSSSDSPFALRKGGVCALRLPRLAAGAAELRWVLSPSLLRVLGR